MNLFWLDIDPQLAAQAHQDVHVGKMLLEAVQLLCTAFEEQRSKRAATPTERLAYDLLPYTHTHYKHPCAMWVRASRANFDATIELASALAAEFRYRFDKSHGSEAALNWVKRHRSEAQVPDGLLTPYALAMPEQYQYLGDDSLSVWDKPRAAYRAYYRAEKRGHWRTKRSKRLHKLLETVGLAKPERVWVPAKWTKRDPPEWF